MKHSTYYSMGNWSNNEPSSSESFPENSILPERFRSISEPSEVPILPDDFNSLTIPVQQLVEMEN